MTKRALTLGFGALAGLPWLLFVSAAAAQDATTAGEAKAPYPTLENLSIEWPIAGDDNNNGVVTVRFRSLGSDSWRMGLPLRRVPGGENEGFAWENRHAGSVFGLSPATAYEVELTLEDPDGGAATTTLEATTRPVPTVPEDASVVTVTPENFADRLSQAAPGQELVLEDGNYDAFSLDGDGEPGRPIVIRARSERQAVISGDIELIGRSHVFLEGLTIQGRVRVNDSEGIVVRRCLIQTDGWGIVAYGNGSTNGYYCDNEVLGPSAWAEGTVGADGDNLGEGIELAGPGNVVCRNRVRGFRDCISTMEDDEAVNQVSLDVYRNDLRECADDAVEADFTMGNCRIYQNQVSDSFVGISSQPSLGGPSYFIRNVMYNVIYSPFKLHRGSVGDVAFHNTVVKCGDALAVFADVSWSAAWFRNNLFLGGTGGNDYGGYSNGDGAVANLPAAAVDCDFDYDGFGSIGTGEFRGNIGGTRFESLEELRASTTEVHATEVALDVFAASIAFPETPFPAKGAPDLHLRSGGAAIDVGQSLANINDDFAGDAPDLGAYELAATPIDYGPTEDPGSAGAAGAGGAMGRGGTNGRGGDTAEGGETARGGREAQGGTEDAGTVGVGGHDADGGSTTTDGGSDAADGGKSAAGEPAEAGAAGAEQTLNRDATGKDDGGCGCRVATSRSTGSAAWLFAAVVMLLGRRRTTASRTRSRPS